jgi:hypothetical protein
MTFALVALGQKSIWAVADRMLTFEGNTRRDAIKLAEFQADDGVAVIAYAGLGETAGGTQPSQWITNVLRGYKPITVEQGLALLAKATFENLAPRLNDLPQHAGKSHVFLIAAHIDKKPHLFTIEVEVDGAGVITHARHTRWVNARGVPHRIAVAGSGAACAMRERRLLRHVLTAIQAAEKGKARHHEVSELFAMVNRRVAANVSSVSTECIVLWRIIDEGGGAHRWFPEPDGELEFIPTVGGGMPVHEIVSAILPTMQQHLENVSRGQEGEIDPQLMQWLIDHIKDTPDNTLE